jgi:acyl-CoA dehydrogenase
MSGDLLGETVERLFAERGPKPWREAAELGLPWVSVPEAAGGSGGDLDDAFTILFCAGRHAAALPLAETGMLGGWLLSEAGLRVPDGPLAVGPGGGLTLQPQGSGWTVTGRLPRVPWGADAAFVVALASAPGGHKVVLLAPGEAELARGRNLAGEPRDTLTVDGVALEPARVGPAPLGAAEWLALRGAAARALLMAGAMDAVRELTVGYAGSRAQFGRPIASFQAVAHRLAQLAAAAEAAALAARVASAMLTAASRKGSEAPPPEVIVAVAAAKVTAGRSAREVAAHAHQVHGAVGMTEEYELHHFTKRLWCWSREWGSEARWARTLGERVVDSGAPALWPTLTSGLVERGRR